MTSTLLYWDKGRVGEVTALVSARSSQKQYGLGEFALTFAGTYWHCTTKTHGL